MTAREAAPDMDEEGMDEEAAPAPAPEAPTPAPEAAGGLFGLPTWVVVAGGAAALYFFTRKG